MLKIHVTDGNLQLFNKPYKKAANKVNTIRRTIST